MERDASFVTGGQNIKIGYQGAYLVDNRNFGGQLQQDLLTYRLNNGVPDQSDPEHRRLTSAPAGGIPRGLRSGTIHAGVARRAGRPALRPCLELLPRADRRRPSDSCRPHAVPETQGVMGYNDLRPRGGVAYDVFGNGKTSLKFNFGRYLEAAQNAGCFTANNPTGRLSTPPPAPGPTTTTTGSPTATC